jgi:hypothetical protein
MKIRPTTNECTPPGTVSQQHSLRNCAAGTNMAADHPCNLIRDQLDMALLMLRNALKKKEWRNCYLVLEQAASFISRIFTLLPYYDQRSGRLEEVGRHLQEVSGMLGVELGYQPLNELKASASRAISGVNAARKMVAELIDEADVVGGQK